MNYKEEKERKNERAHREQKKRQKGSLENFKITLNSQRIEMEEWKESC